MVRLTLLTLTCLTLLIACSEKETQSVPKAARAQEAPALEQPETELEEVDEIDFETDDPEEDSDLLLELEEIVPGDEETDLLEEIEEITASASAGYQGDASHDSNQTVGSAVGTETHYTVRAGDTLGQIAITHNVTLDSLVRANNLSDKNTIRIGQQLTLE